MKRSHVLATGSAVIVLFAASLVASPYWELQRLRAAVADHDAEAVSRRVDFPALRASVKDQLAAAIARDRPRADGNPFAAVGQAMALAFLGPMVDAIVSPIGVIAMMESGRIHLSRREVPTQGHATDSAGAPARPRYAMSWRGWNEVVLASDQPDGGGFLFRRDGLWRWKLSGIELRHAQP
ncbi:DUF2939 domain-containing protein [uncultured Massilia sp.]|uniref:DUF2939 domain-containing protein n=1 Tax=uncultured Massilia sp. TaxID=169973 RepID=UPI0025FDA2C9|nr:DUF2939 domain-containing protein [uncultured Massilia sp.]